MASHKRFPIVGIGASAGGVEALQGLFRAMPAGDGMAFVIVTHLGPNRESDLPSIISHCTAMPVKPALDGEPVRSGQVHVLPNDSILTIADGHLKLRPQDPTVPRERQPIDVFFASLAQDQGDCAVGIVLSGGGSDGSLGLKAIKEHGGLTLAQGVYGSAPRHPSMPESAIATGTVDLVLPVEQIPAQLVQFAHNLGSFSSEGASRLPAEHLGSVRAGICDILRRQVAHDFSGYKEKSFMRRVHRRMQVVRLTDIDAYVEHLRHDHDEAVALFRDLLINVTGFFRDAPAFANLTKSVLPTLFEGRGADDTVRIWVPGCATGEEAYTLAILLRERMDELRGSPRVKIFATDIDEPALGIARTGRYPAQLLIGVSPTRLARFFTSDGAAFAVNKEVRDLCVFSAHSLIRDPPFSRIDLISCRNLLIYLDGQVQDRVIPTFHYALRPGGFLLLGISESVGRHSELFVPTEKMHRIFRRRDHARTDLSHRVLPFAQPGLARPGQPARASRARRPVAEPDLRQTVEGVILDRFTPAYVVVDQHGDILLQSGRLGKYVEPPAGAPSRQILETARRGLRLDLRAALRDAMETRSEVVRPLVEVEFEGRVQTVTLTVTPLPIRDGAEPLFAVVFADVGSPVEAEEATRVKGGGDDAAAALLERELRETRERLQSTIEEYETAVEELRSANEEMVSVNEELQSANEELETAKEEQQSINEELQTVNLELAGKVQELDRANGDLRNLFESTRIATVFLDRNLLIRGFTPAVAGIFNLIPTDLGRPLTDVAAHFEGVDVSTDLQAVLDRRELSERRIVSRISGQHYLMRSLPYRGAEGSMDGVLVTFVDVSQMIEAEAQLRTLIDELNHRVRNTLQVVMAVATRTLRGSPAPQDFARTFNGRLRALGRAHDLVARESWRDVSLSELVAKELEPYAAGPSRVSINGPPLRLPPKAALALGMAVHELTTNAAKHGALSVEAGQVSVTWSLEGTDPDAQFVLRWREEGGPRVQAPVRRGFGSDLIERQLRYDLRGDINVEFPEEGLRATLTIPLASRLETPAASTLLLR